MKQKLVSILCITVTCVNYAQIKFEKGYFINNADQKTECLIKNIDWNNNPSEFQYKISEQEEPKFASIKTVKEFGVYEGFIYKRHTVSLDRSSELSDNLSTSRRPEFTEETLFLKILVQGDANLYFYKETNLKRFFFKIVDKPLEPLIYKRYLGNDNYTIHTNDYFRQQLSNTLKCDKIKQNQFENASYYKKNLISIVESFNHCKDNTFTNTIQNKKRGFIHLTPKIGVQQASLDINNPNSVRSTNFGSEIGLRIGLELEYVLPFNKNKWSLSVAPTYQSFNSEKIIQITQQDVVAKAEYTSIDIPFNLRHYFFISDQSKIFVNAAYVVSTTLDSEIIFGAAGALEISAVNHVAFGLGFMYKKYSAELRYDFSRDILSDFISWDSDYNILSFSIGYRIF